MSILGHLEPANVFRFFEEICNIPHGSGNIDKISVEKSGKKTLINSAYSTEL